MRGIFELVALSAVLAAATSEPAVTYSSTVLGPSSASTVSRTDDVHVSPIYTDYPYFYAGIPLTASPFHTNLEPYTAVQIARHLIKKRSVYKPDYYISATPYAPTFYAPASPGSYSITSLLPRGPFVSAYTVHSHYIKKRSTEIL